MLRRPSILLCAALSAVVIAAPSVSKLGTDSLYSQAFAEKGGNGKGGGSGGRGGKSGGSQSAGKNGSSSGTNFAAINAAGKQKQLALSDPLAPAHPSMLGRWNAAKPIEHPAIQAHIRNGKFNGTIGMIAAYAYAQTTYNSLEAQLAVTEETLANDDLETLQTNLTTALNEAGYADLAAYETAVAGGEPKVDGVETAKGAIETYQQAEAVIAAGELALDNLATAEANMEAYSNRAPWSEIRDDVRAKMGLDPVENDLVSAPTSEVTQQ